MVCESFLFADVCGTTTVYKRSSACPLSVEITADSALVMDTSFIRNAQIRTYVLTTGNADICIQDDTYICISVTHLFSCFFSGNYN